MDELQPHLLVVFLLEPTLTGSFMWPPRPCELYLAVVGRLKASKVLFIADLLLLEDEEALSFGCAPEKKDVIVWKRGMLCSS